MTRCYSEIDHQDQLHRCLPRPMLWNRIEYYFGTNVEPMTTWLLQGSSATVQGNVNDGSASVAEPTTKRDEELANIEIVTISE